MPRRPDPFSRAILPEEIRPEEPQLVGVSGGRDSVALLHWLVEQGFRHLTVCHLDHALRPESREDARFVGRLAGELGLPLVTKRAAVATLAKRRRLSLETAAREARYDFFAAVAKKQRCPRILLAHHADDQVETFLFNLLRGSGSGGLGGMAPLSSREIAGIPLAIARPLLRVWREEIDGFVDARELAFREDASNTDPRHTRNRVRHTLLPALASALGRDVRQSLWRAAELLRAEDEYLSSQLPPPTAELSAAALRIMPLAIQRRVIHAWLRQHAVPNVGFEEVESVRRLLDPKVAKVNLPGGLHARRSRQQIRLV